MTQRFDPIQSSLNAGELSPKVSGAVDLDKYRAGLALCENFLPLTQGPATFRPGLRFIAPCKYPNLPARLCRFEYNAGQSFALEWGNYYLRFYINHAQVLTGPGGDPYEIATPYFSDEIWQLYLRPQSADVFFILHPNHPPNVLTRIASNAWTIGPYAIEDGPYYDLNITTITLQPSANTGAITLTAAGLGGSPVVNGGFNYNGGANQAPDFSNPYWWPYPADWSFAGIQDVMVHTPGAANPLSLGLPGLMPAAYILAYQISGRTAGTLTATLGGTAGATRSANGSFTETILAGATPLNLRLTPSSDFDGTVADVSLLRSSYDLGWTHGADWLFNGVNAAHQGGTVSLLSQALAGLQVLAYQVSYQVSGCSAGGVTVSLGGTPGTERTANGVYTESLTPGAGNLLLALTPTSDFNGAVSQVSVILGTPMFFQPGHLGSRWRLQYQIGSEPAAWAANTAYNAGDLASWNPTGATSGVQTWFCYQGGTSGPGPTTPPTAAKVAGDRISDGTVIWQCLSTSTGGYAWGTVQITGIISASEANAEVLIPLFGTSPTIAWREGAWSAYRGYPRCAVFHGGRLVFAGTSDQPNTLWGSRVNDYPNFTPQDETVTDDGPFSYTLDAEDVNAIVWLASMRVLMAGTSNAEWRICGGTSVNGPITPSSVQATQETKYGSGPVPPESVGNVLLFAQPQGNASSPPTKIRELTYFFADDSYVAPDLTIMAEHITRGGIVDLAFQKDPQQMLWAVRADGTLLAMIYERAEKVVGWSRQVTDGIVESVCVIPGKLQAELWLVVQRQINGATVRYVEMMEALDWTQLSADGDLAYAFFVDCGLSYDGPFMNVFGGLDHLEGETVVGLVDGRVSAPAVVGGGQVTLPSGGSVVQLGLPYKGTYQTLRPEGGSRQGTSQGKKKRLHEVWLRLLNSWGGLVGPDAEHLEPIMPRLAEAYMDTEPVLQTGDVKALYRGDYETGGQVTVVQDLPLPFTICAQMPRLEITEQ